MVEAVDFKSLEVVIFRQILAKSYLCSLST